MQIQYSPLFTINFRHDYFPEGNCSAVELVPTQETSAIMQQLGIRARSIDFGQAFYYNSAPPPSGQLLQTDQLVKLSFLLQTQDPIFHNYTELPLGVDSAQYFTNLGSTASSPPLMAGAGNVLPVKAAAFTLPVSPAGGNLTLHDEMGDKLYDASAEEDKGAIQLANDEGTSAKVNLAGLAPGRYTIKVEDEILLDFLLAPKNWRPGSLGLLSVYIGDTITNGHYIRQDQQVTPVTYTIEFAARPTIWRYHLIDANDAYEGFELVDPNSGGVVVAAAATPTTRQLPDGNTAVILTAPAAIPLRAQPGPTFTLQAKNKGAARNTPLSIPLPSADANRLGRGQPDDATAGVEATFFSDIYVYL